MVKPAVIFSAVCVWFVLANGAFQGSGYWPEFYPYLHCDQDCLDSMLNVNVRWQKSQGTRGWNKYRFGLVGNSITNDGPFPSDLSEGRQSPGSWTGSGIINCVRPNNTYWDNFLTETWGGPGGASNRDHPWLYDLPCHYAANGNQVGAKTAEGFALLGNALNNLNPMWVTLEFGHNDDCYWNSTRRAEWMRLLKRSLDSNVIPIIVTLNPEQPGSAYDHEGRTPVYNDSLRAFAARYRVPCLDWYGAAVDPLIGGCTLRSDYCTRDGAHPERSQSSGNFSDSVIFYPLAQAKGVLNPVCGLWNIMLLETTLELRQKVIYKADTVVATGVYASASATPDNIEISTAPSPFNPSTIVSFVLPGNNSAGAVTISIFNTSGKKVKTLANRMYTPGTYSVTWDGKDDENRRVATGVYSIIINNGKIIKACRTILVK